MNIHRYIFPPLTSFVMLWHGVALGEGDSLDQKAREESKKERLEALESAPRKSTPRFKGYASQRKLFDRLCAALEKDGRKLKYYEITAAQNEKIPECVACQPLFKQFATSCKPKKSKQGDIQKATQTEPHIEVLVASSALMRTLAENPLRLQTIDAIERLLFILRSKSLFSPAEAAYFSLLADYFEAPWSLVKAEKLRHEGAEQESDPVGEAEKKEALDTLF